MPPRATGVGPESPRILARPLLSLYPPFLFSARSFVLFPTGFAIGRLLNLRSDNETGKQTRNMREGDRNEVGSRIEETSDLKNGGEKV